MARWVLGLVVQVPVRALVYHILIAVQQELPGRAGQLSIRVHSSVVGQLHSGGVLDRACITGNASQVADTLDGLDALATIASVGNSNGRAETRHSPLHLYCSMSFQGGYGKN